MATILDPSASNAVAVHSNQPLRLVADAATNWWSNTNGAASWTQFATATSQPVLVTPTTVTRRFTFDDVRIVAQPLDPTSNPILNNTLTLNVCEGPAAGLHVSSRIRNEALQEPPANPDTLESDDPPLGFPLAMPGANRDGLGTVLLERAYESSGPANLVSLYGPGLQLDSAGKLGQRTPVGRNRGLGIVPSIASYHWGGFYFAYDFGRSRTLSLTRVAFEDGSGNANVAVVRGDGRRNTYRYLNFNSGSGVTYYTPAALLQNSLVKSGNFFLETTPSGTYFVYNSTGTLKGKPTVVLDRYGTPIYFLYDANNKLQKVQGVPLAGQQGLVPYLGYDANGRCNLLVLQDNTTAANNRTTYFTYDAAGNLNEITGPELCTAYYAYDSNFNLLSVTDSENFTWRAYYDYNSGGSTGLRATALVDALGNPAYYAYDTANAITTWVDRAGKATYFQPNAYGSPLAVWNVGTPADYYQYEAYFVADKHVVDSTQSGSLLWSKNRLGNSWYYQYDSVGNRIAVNDPLTARSYFAYDPTKFLLQTFTDALGHQVYLAYDANRNNVFKVDPIGNTTYYAYTKTGLTYFRQDRRGAFTYFVFDPTANMTAFRDPLNNTTYFNYNSAGDRVGMIDPLGRVSSWNYDRKSRVISTIDPLQATRLFAYDAACNLVTEVDPRSFTTYHAFNGNDDQVANTDPLGNVTSLGYDPEQRLQLRRDARLNTTYWSYDVLGRRQNQTDPFGGVKYWAYDAAHEVSFSLDELKNASYLDYDATGRAAHQVDAFMNVSYMGYDLKGNRVKTVDKRGNASITYFEPRDLVAYTQNAIGAFNYFKYDQELNRIASVDALGQVGYMNYDLRGLTVNTQDAYNNFTYWEYDAARQRTRQLLPPQNGSSVLAPTTWDYDLAGRQRNTTDAFSNTSYMTYDLSGNLVLTLNQRQATNATVFQYFNYDPDNRQVETRDLGELRTYYYFDSVGNRVQVDQEQGFGRQPWGTSPYGGERVSTYFTFDALNRQSTGLSATSVYSQTIALTYVGYDAASNRVQTRVENPQGGPDKRFSYWTYDRLNRVLTSIDPNATTSGGSGGITYFGYDPNSNRVLVQDQEGRFSYFTFDAINRTQNQSDVFGDTTYMVYDLRNSLTRRIDPVGRPAYYDFDNLARQIRQSNALGQVSYMGYDARSERVLAQNPRGFSTTFAYDLLGRLSTQTDALSGVRYFGYDPVGNKVLAVDERNNPTYWVYDQANRVRMMQDALGGQFYYGYDAAGSLRQKTDADGRYTSFGYFGYDASRRPTTMSFSNPVAGETADPWIYYAYDSLGNLTSSVDATGTNSWVYDALNRVTAKTSLAGQVYYLYDRTGNKTAVVQPSVTGSVFGGTYYSFDAANRLLQASPFDASGIRGAYYTYDPSGLMLSKILPGNNVVTYQGYDVAGRLSLLNNLNSSGSVVSYFAYQHDQKGNIASVAHESGVTTYYAYDPLDRLTGEAWVNSSGGAIYAFYYNYDAAWNRLQKWVTAPSAGATYYAYNSLNLVYFEYSLPAAGTNYYTFDKSYRMKTRAAAGGGGAVYFSYDERDEVTQYKSVNSLGATNELTYYTYNGVGERVFGFDGGGTLGVSYWVYDKSNLLMERAGSTRVLWRHNHTPEGATASAIEHALSDGSSFAYPTFDQTGSTKVLIAPPPGPGASDLYLYDAFGVRIGATVGFTEALSNRLQFNTPELLRSNAAQQEFYLTKLGNAYLPSLGLPVAQKRDVAVIMGGENGPVWVDPPADTWGTNPDTSEWEWGHWEIRDGHGVWVKTDDRKPGPVVPPPPTPDPPSSPVAPSPPGWIELGRAPPERLISVPPLPEVPPFRPEPPRGETPPLIPVPPLPGVPPFKPVLPPGQPPAQGLGLPPLTPENTPNPLQPASPSQPGKTEPQDPIIGRFGSMPAEPRERDPWVPHPTKPYEPPGEAEAKRLRNDPLNPGAHGRFLNPGTWQDPEEIKKRRNEEIDEWEKSGKREEKGRIVPPGLPIYPNPFVDPFGEHFKW